MRMGWKVISPPPDLPPQGGGNGGKPVREGFMAEWKTVGLSEGAYTLRLTVKNSQNKVDVKRKNIQVKTPPQDTIPPATVTG